MESCHDEPEHFAHVRPSGCKKIEADVRSAGLATPSRATMELIEGLLTLEPHALLSGRVKRLQSAARLHLISAHRVASAK